MIAIVCAIAKAASGDRYSKMTEEEFEAEAQRSSWLGGTVAGLQRFLDPSHRVEYVQEQQERVEADGAPSGDSPVWVRRRRRKTQALEFFMPARR